MAIPHDTLKIAVISDPHAFSGPYEDSSPSWVALGDDQANARTNPFAGVSKLITREGLKADIIICGGDLGDKASPEGQQYVWHQIEALRLQLGAAITLATAGNHDVDSRLVHTDHDARGQMQALDPLFPIANQAKWMEYWAQNYTIVIEGGVRFVLLNSSAYHGYAKDGVPAEYNQGRISDRTLNRLMKDLESEKPFAANVLLCHHHPYKNDLIKIADYSEMKNGDRLVNDLTRLRKGPWLIVHGHKHIPRLFYAPGGNASPAIFSAGSFSAKLWQETYAIARNEFYVIDLHVPRMVGAATSVKGRITTWQWSYGNGWLRPRIGEGLGPLASFGTRTDTGELAAEIVDYLTVKFPGKSVVWDEVSRYRPAVDFLIPDDLAHLLHILNEVYQVRPVPNFETGMVEQLQVPA